MTFMLRKRGWQAPRGSIVLTTVRLIAGLALPAVGCDSSTESEVSIRVGGLSESSVLTSSPAAVDFGWLLPDATLVRRSVTIANIGTVRAMLGAPRFVGTSNGSFSVQQTACWGVSLEPGGSCVTTLAFHPAQGTGLTDALVISGEGTGSLLQIPLVGRSARLSLNASPSLVDFGPKLWSVESVRTVRMTTPVPTAPVLVPGSGVDPGPNPGSVRVRRLTVEGVGAAAFRVTRDTCTGQTIAAGAACELDVTFLRGLRDNPVEARISIDSNASNPSAGVRLLGYVVSEAVPTQSQPFEPPTVDDRTFLSTGMTSWDACFSSGTAMTFDVPVTRVITNVTTVRGETGPSAAAIFDVAGQLTPMGRAHLVARGVIEPFATLRLSARGWSPGARYRVLVNGHLVDYFNSPADVWQQMSFRVPVEALSFPVVDGPVVTGSFRRDGKPVWTPKRGHLPTPTRNVVSIEMDARAPDHLWCLELGWAALGIKAMSPVILVHGNNSDGDQSGNQLCGFFCRRGFRRVLEEVGFPHSAQISMDMTTHGRVKDQAVILDRWIPWIAESFGADSVHLVGHSKGGLSLREWLAASSRNHGLHALTLTTLSTPHEGSPLADLLVRQEQAAYITGPGYDAVVVDIASRLLGTDKATRDLTTWSAQAFDYTRLTTLPQRTVYRALAGDADLNGDWDLDHSPLEYAAALEESSDLADLYHENPRLDLSKRSVNIAYKFLRNYSRVDLVRTLVGNVGVVIPNETWSRNDLLVPIWSAHTNRASSPFIKVPPFVGARGKDHASIADGEVARTIVPMLQETEKEIGDFRP